MREGEPPAVLGTLGDDRLVKVRNLSREEEAMRLPRAFVPVVFVTLLFAGCAKAVATRTPATIQLGIHDTGTTVSVHVGDRLVITLPPSQGPVPKVPQGWSLATYPRDALELVTNDPKNGHFEFIARAVGGGKILVLGRCSPGPAVAGGAPCPLDVGPGAMPPRPLAFNVTVQVT
jgi:hypothetical protein